MSEDFLTSEKSLKKSKKKKECKKMYNYIILFIFLTQKEKSMLL